MKPKSSIPQSKSQGNYIDAFFKQMFSRVFVFVDFLLHYADKDFISQVDLKRISPAPSHYTGAGGDERIADKVFYCPLKNGNGRLMAIIVFEHQSTELKTIPYKLLKYVSAIWDAEMKESKPLSAPYLIVLRTGKKPHRKPLPTIADSLPKDKNGKPVGKMVEIDYDVVDLPKFDFDKIVGGAVLRSVLMLLHTITGGNIDDFPEALKPLMELPDGEKMVITGEMLPFITKAFAVKNRKLDEAAITKALNPIFEDKTMIKTIFEEKMEEGEAKAGRNMVLVALRTKFKRVPKDVEKAVLSMTDPIALESLLAQAIQSETMNEFTEALR